MSAEIFDVKLIQPMMILLIVIAAFLFPSCTFEREVVEKPREMYWPMLPAEPKMKFVEEIQSGSYVEEKGGFLKKFIDGEDDLSGRLKKPYGIAVDKNGRIYVTDIGRVFLFDKKNNKLLFVGENSPIKLRMPIGIAVSSDGRVYVSDSVSDIVLVYNSEGKFAGTIGQAGELRSPSGLAIDEVRRRIFVADTRKNLVMVYSLDGKSMFQLCRSDDSRCKLNLPTNIAVDSEGNIYVTDTGNFRVMVFNPEGMLFKTIGGSSRKDIFIRPKGIAVDSEGHIYVADAAAQKFFMLDKEGKLLFSLGGGGSNPGQFSVPAGIAVDAEDRIYVVDQMNGRVQIFQYLSEKWKAGQSSPKKIETR